MAEMFPEDVDRFGTPGEGVVYRFLRSAARPDRDFTAWYTPHIEDREPDFVLFGREIGLLVIEVKDWAVRQIRTANPEHFELRIGSGSERRRNPLRQAEGYSIDLRRRLARDRLLGHQHGPHRGKSRIPVSEAVALPNIGEDGYRQAGLEALLPRPKVLLAEDLADDGLAADPSGARFREELTRRFPPLFTFAAGKAEQDALREVLFPEIRIEHPARERGADYEERRSRLLVLDRQQQRLAMQLGPGHRIITGPSGSGKSLVLAHRAGLLRQYDPSIRSVLLVCYNGMLTGYLRELLSLNRVPMGEGAVEVLPFFEVCEKIIGEHIEHEGQTGEYYEMVLDVALERIERGAAPSWDAIIVDEGQDFSTRMLQVIRGVLSPESDNLLIALDVGQDIYARQKVWREAGIDARGRVRRLKHVYRSSRRLVSFSRALVEGLGPTGPGNSVLQQPPLPFPALSLEQGPVPELVEVETLDAAVQAAADWMREQADDIRPLSECAVLYARTTPVSSTGPDYPERIGRALNDHGLDSRWVGSSYERRRHYRISTNAVTISTIHSSKGLDWECVALLGLDELRSDELSRADRLLAYVAVCRARRRLLIPYVRRTPLIELFIASARGLD